jgi:hypothetical protein
MPEYLHLSLLRHTLSPPAFRLHKPAVPVQVVQRLVSAGLAALTTRQYNAAPAAPQTYLSSCRAASFAVLQLFLCSLMCSFPTQFLESKNRPLS